MDRTEQVSFDDLPEGMKKGVIEVYGPPEQHAHFGLVFFKEKGTQNYLMVMPARRPN